jgi:hypothetical protein
MENPDQKQSPNQTATTRADIETRQINTTNLLNPMSGYVQHTTQQNTARVVAIMTKILDHND